MKKSIPVNRAGRRKLVEKGPQTDEVGSIPESSAPRHEDWRILKETIHQEGAKGCGVRNVRQGGK